MDAWSPPDPFSRIRDELRQEPPHVQCRLMAMAPDLTPTRDLRLRGPRRAWRSLGYPSRRGCDCRAGWRGGQGDRSWEDGGRCPRRSV